MNGLSLFKKTIEKRIDEISSIIRENEDLYFSLDKILEIISTEGIINLNEQDSNFILESLSYKAQLTSSESEFVSLIGKLDKNTKMYISSIGLDDRQRATALSVERKLQVIKNNRSKYENDLYTELDEYEKVLSNISSDDFISDIDEIKQILDKLNFNLEDQVDVFNDINIQNLTKFQEYQNEESIESEPPVIIVDEEPIIEDNLEETNTDDSTLKKIFEDFSLDYDAIYSRATKYKKELSKYADIKKVSDILSYINGVTALKFIYKNPEILTNILLFSSVENLKLVVETTSKYNINGIISKYPTILYPCIRKKSNINNDGKTYQTGSMFRFLSIVKFLEQMDIDIYTAYTKCSTFFILNPDTINEILRFLKLYGIDENHIKKNPVLSVFRSFPSVQKNLDIGIEVGSFCLDYLKENMSRLSSAGQVNFYRIKYDKKLNNNSSTSNPYSSNYGTKSRVLKGRYSEPTSVLGNKPSDTFELYGAVEPYIEQRELYDSIIEQSNNSSVSKSVYRNKIIKQLDELYFRNPLVYDFDGVIISRIKVLRYFETLKNSGLEVSRDMLLYVICINSMLDSDELDKINNCLDKVNFVRRNLK